MERDNLCRLCIRTNGKSQQEYGLRWTSEDQFRHINVTPDELNAIRHAAEARTRYLLWKQSAGAGEYPGTGPDEALAEMGFPFRHEPNREWHRRWKELITSVLIYSDEMYAAIGYLALWIVLCDELRHKGGNAA